MGEQEHRVSAEGGKYTFVMIAGDHRVSILRYDEPWHGPQGEGAGAIHALMCELDAARLVLRAARACVEVFGASQHFPSGLVDALRRHDALVSDSTPPSAWAEGSGDRGEVGG
jgi:hypothetical protein